MCRRFILLSQKKRVLKTVPFLGGNWGGTIKGTHFVPFSTYLLPRNVQLCVGIGKLTNWEENVENYISI